MLENIGNAIEMNHHSEGIHTDHWRAKLRMSSGLFGTASNPIKNLVATKLGY